MVEGKNKTKLLQNEIQRDDVFDKWEGKKQILHFSPPASRVLNLHEFLIDLVTCCAFWSRRTWDEAMERFRVSVWGERH